jgi:hypothetical protein
MPVRRRQEYDCVDVTMAHSSNVPHAGFYSSRVWPLSRKTLNHRAIDKTARQPPGGALF